MNRIIGIAVVAAAGLAGVGVAAHRAATANTTGSMPQPAAVAVPAEPVAAPVAAAPVVTEAAFVPAAAPAPVVASGSDTRGQTTVVRRHVITRRASTGYYVHERSKKHSAMIIGGSALGGAGIGALVGGGKGALIGGLVGGAAGTVYDRKTHKRIVRRE